MKTELRFSQACKSSNTLSMWISKTGLRPQRKFGSNLESSAAFPVSSISVGATGLQFARAAQNKQHRNMPGHYYCRAAMHGKHSHKYQCVWDVLLMGALVLPANTRLPHQDSDILGSLKAWTLLHEL